MEGKVEELLKKGKGMGDRSGSGLGSVFDVDNPYFAAGFGLVGVATGLAALRQGVALASMAIRRHLLVTLEVSSRDASYPWVLQWIGSRSDATQHYSVVTSSRPLDSSGQSPQAAFELVPAPGTHYFLYGSRWVQVNRTREKGPGDLTSGVPFETVTLTTLGRSRKVMDRILAEARELAAAREEGKTIVYTAWGSDWRPFGFPRRRRPLDSVLLDAGVSERIEGDVTDFLASSQWYIERGIPYRRGYLLHGPPGCGKTSYIMALAGHLGFNICLINLSEKGLSDDRLGHLMATAPKRSFLVLEDIDAAFSGLEDDVGAGQGGLRRRDESVSHAMAGMRHGVTFSGLLNVLDGVASTEERLVFMTTNHVDRLDPALVRPGRVDVQEYIGRASEHQLRAMFVRFYPDASPDLADTFVRGVHLAKPSMAQVQGYLMRYKGQPRTAVAELPPPGSFAVTAAAAHSSHAFSPSSSSSSVSVSSSSPATLPPS